MDRFANPDNPVEGFPEQSEESDHEYIERRSKPEDFVENNDDKEDDGS